jgi:hypothetical protein
VGTTNLQPDDARPGHARIKVLRATLADPLRIAQLVSSDAWLGSAQVLKRDERSSVLAGRVDSLPIIVKCVRLNRPKDTLSRITGTTRGLRQWHGGTLLARRGFDTPELLVLARGRDATGCLIETLVMERIEGQTLLEAVAHSRAADRVEPGAPAALSPITPEVLARQAGELAAWMSRAGLRNRDLKPSNIIVARTKDGPRLVQIDTVGVREDAGAEVPEMLFRLLVECVGTGHTPCRTLRWRAALAAANGDTARAKTLWRNVESRLARHGDPTPKVNPLGPA